MSAVSAVRARLPRGDALPPEVWRSRHGGITALLWLHVLGLLVIGLVRDVPLRSVLPGVLVVAVLAGGACLPRLGSTARSAMATLGLVTASAVLVYLFDGATEVHFHYFVIVAVVALYQAWWPYLLAVGFVLVEHGLVGTIAPGLVFDMDMSASHTWDTAAVHGGFILAESVACVMFWRASEQSLDRERNALGEAERSHQDLVRAQQLANIGSWSLDTVTDKLTWSEQMYTLAGRDPASFTPSMATVMDVIHPDDVGRVVASLASAVSGGDKLDMEYRMVGPDRQVTVVHALSEQPVAPDGTSSLRIGTVHDVTERTALQQKIEHLAYHDPLTGLANRRLFLRRLDEALGRRRTPPSSTCAVLYLDLNDFKQINDTFGHSVGDTLLRVTAERLSQAVRSDDLVGRLGGDEFAILLEKVDLTTTRRIAETIGERVRQPMRLEGTELTVLTSIGFALGEEQSTSDDLMRNADAAMYAMKTRRASPAGIFPTDPGTTVTG